MLILGIQIEYMKVVSLLVFILFSWESPAQTIPLPEHPRPDFERERWINLNGTWDFEFDSLNKGLQERWFSNQKSFSKKIVVPFPWGSPLSGVPDISDIAWYKRMVSIPTEWQGSKIFITVGASDWESSLWLDGVLIGLHQGGYMPFSFDLTPHIKAGQQQTLVLRVDDKRRAFTLYGKQGYGNARGIWQTVYVESRGNTYIESIQAIPDIKKNSVTMKIGFPQVVNANLPVQVNIQTPQGEIKQQTIVNQGESNVAIEIFLPNARWWSLDDPYLYFVNIQAGEDKVTTYFGMRSISVVPLPGTTIPYIAINNQPVYLQLALDQSYHPEGYYTFPSDEFMKQEIIRSKSIGLNGIRTHIKPDLPRKLYWADKLGLLVMADLPNSWGEPDELMKKESETTLREMILRDYNHPSIFSWIVFNETWGLTHKITQNGKTSSQYLPSTQYWVSSMYYLAKSLDPTRLVEDNSICCGRGHTETDINSWHEYLPGWAWEDHLQTITKNNFPGSTYHFEKGFAQNNQPNINSECGNVWGYEGSTGDVDWSYDYHRMINSFRKFPKVSGWLYTEHHDVINEWNGYWKFDRTEKFTGVEELVPGMKIKDFHSAYYLSTGNEIGRTVKGGEVVSLPLYLSIYSPQPVNNNQLVLHYEMLMTDAGGETSSILKEKKILPVQPWDQKTLDPLSLKMPDYRGLALLRLYLTTYAGDTLHRNFCFFEILSDKDPDHKFIFEVKPNAFTKQQWDKKQWNVMDGLKVNGTGKGYFEYKLPLDKKSKWGKINSANLVMELSAKQVFDKDLDSSFNQNQDYMLGSRVSSSKNPNAYPMTDESRFPSEVSIQVEGKTLLKTVLPDDPADHRGLLSWHHQLMDKKLREAGSYGYLINIPISKSVLRRATAQGFLRVKIKSEGEGGLAIYGSEFGRYPVNINLVLNH